MPLTNSYFSGAGLMDLGLDRGGLHLQQSFELDARCVATARGVDCECSCLGEHHGCDSDGTWFEVNEVFACRWGARKYAVRLLVESRRHNPTYADLLGVGS